MIKHKVVRTYPDGWVNSGGMNDLENALNGGWAVVMCTETVLSKTKPEIKCLEYILAMDDELKINMGFNEGLTIMRKTEDSLLVGFDFTKGIDETIMVVGRKKPNQSVKVINIIKGEEAEKIYDALVMSPPYAGEGR